MWKDFFFGKLLALSWKSWHHSLLCHWRFTVIQIIKQHELLVCLPQFVVHLVFHTIILLIHFFVDTFTNLPLEIFMFLVVSHFCILRYIHLRMFQCHHFYQFPRSTQDFIFLLGTWLGWVSWKNLGSNSVSTWVCRANSGWLWNTKSKGLNLILDLNCSCVYRCCYGYGYRCRCGCCWRYGCR